MIDPKCFEASHCALPPAFYRDDYLIEYVKDGKRELVRKFATAGESLNEDVLYWGDGWSVNRIVSKNNQVYQSTQSVRDLAVT